MKSILKLRKKIQNIKDPLYRNSFFLILGRFSSAFFGFMFWLLIARFYIEYDVGIISSISTTLKWISIIALIGLDDTIRRYSVNKSVSANRLILGSTFVVTITSVITVISLLLILGTIDVYNSVMNVFWNKMIFILLGVEQTISFILDAIFVSRRKGELVFVRMLVTGILSIGLIFPFKFLGIIGPFLALALSSLLIYSLFSIKYIPKFIR